MKRWRRYEWLFWVVGTLAVLIAAVVFTVGRDGASVDAAAEPEYSWANEAPEALATRIANVVATASGKRDCLLVDIVAARSLAPLRCPAGPELRASLSDFEVVGAREYGTGAIVDYKPKGVGGGATMVLTASADRFWSVARIGVNTDPSTETEDGDSRADFDEAVDRYLAAVRARDCAALEKAVVRPGGRDEACATALASTKALAKRLERNPNYELTYQGGNSTYGFYTVETAKPKPASLTVSVVGSSAGFADSSAVLTVTPAATAAAQRKAERELRKQWLATQAESTSADSTSTGPSPLPKDSPSDE